MIRGRLAGGWGGLTNFPTWSFILYQANLGLFIWQSWDSRRSSKSWKVLLRPRLKTDTPSILLHSIGLNKSSGKPRLKGWGNNCSISWWEELQSHIVRGVVTGRDKELSFLQSSCHTFFVLSKLWAWVWVNFEHEYWVNFVRLDHVCKCRWITTEMEKLIIQKGISLSLQSHNLTFYAIRSFGPLHFGGDFITFTHHRHTVYISWWLTLQGPLIKPVVQAKLLIGCTTVEESIILTQSW